MANRQVNVLLQRGLAGNFYSTGLDVLALKLRKLPGVDYVAVAGYESWRVWAQAIASFKDPTILIGHSFGSNAACRIARELPNVKFPSLISFDPSAYCSFRLGQCGPGYVPPNVTRVLNFIQGNSWLIRGVALRRPDNTSLGIINRDIEHVDHGSIEDAPELHDEAIKEVTRVINA